MGLGIGDGDWGLGPIPNPLAQSKRLNIIILKSLNFPQSPIPWPNLKD